MKNDSYREKVVSEIENELKNISKLHEELDAAAEVQTSKTGRRVYGSILHDFYNCCERVFKKISTEINGGFRSGETWHRDLLYRMTVPIKNVRPPVITEELGAELDDYLSFRHVFRHIYGFELKGERLDRLVARFDPTSRRFRKEIEEFLTKLETDVD